MNKKFKSLMEYIPFIILMKTLSIMPYRLVLWMIEGLFVLVGYGIGIRKKVARAQLKMVYPEMSDKAVNKLLKSMYKVMGASSAETYFSKHDRTYANTVVEGIENVHKALEKGRGVILASAHFGNWEACMDVMMEEKIKLTGIAKTQRNRYFNDYHNKHRAKYGVTHIPFKHALKMTLKRLSENYAVAIVCDQNAGKSGIKLDFLGHPASVYVGPAKISLKTKAPIITCVAVKLDDRSNKFIFEEPIYTDDLESNDANVVAITEEINRHLENFINTYPNNWFWVHKRWKGAHKARVLS